MYRRFYGCLGKIDRGIQTCEKVLICVLLATLIFTIFIQVICRYIFKLPTPSMEELAKFAFIWICYIAGAYALRNNGHVVINLIDSVTDKIPAGKRERVCYILSKLTDLIVFVFLIIVIKQFGLYWLKTFNGTQKTAALMMPMWIPYGGLLLGVILMAWHSLFMLMSPPNYGKTENDKEETK